MTTVHLFLSALLAVSQQPPTPDHPLLLVDEEVFRGRVTRILASNVVEVWGQQRTFRVRLRGVGGLPEGHPLRAEAVELLSRLLESMVELRAVPDPESSEPDELLATILVHGANASQKLLASGLAVYCPPPGGDRELEAAESSAKQQRRGLWSASAPLLEGGGDPCGRQPPVGRRSGEVGR